MSNIKHKLGTLNYAIIGDHIRPVKRDYSNIGVKDAWQRIQHRTQLNAFHKLNLNEWFFNVYAREATANELAVLIHVFNRTIKWNKHFERISHKQLTEGLSIDVNGGTNYVRGTGLSERQTIRLVDSLVEKGLLERIVIGNRKQFLGLPLVHHIDEILPELIKGGEVYQNGKKITPKNDNKTMLRVPKRLQNQTKEDDKIAYKSGLKLPKRIKEVDKNVIENSFEGDKNVNRNTNQKQSIIKQTKNNVIAQGNYECLDQQKNKYSIREGNNPLIEEKETEGFEENNLAKMLELAKQKNEAAVLRRREKQKDKRITVPAVEEVWRRTMLRCHPDLGVTSFSMKHRGQMKNFIKSTVIPDGDMLDFIEWCIESWYTIRSTNTCFEGLPDLLTVPIIVGYRDMLLDRWAKKAELDSMKVGTKLDWRVRYYIKLGYSPEDARERAVTESDVGKQRDANIRRAKELDAREKKLEEAKRPSVQEVNEMIRRRGKTRKENKNSFTSENKEEFFVKPVLDWPEPEKKPLDKKLEPAPAEPINYDEWPEDFGKWEEGE